MKPTHIRVYTISHSGFGEGPTVDNIKDIEEYLTTLADSEQGDSLQIEVREMRIEDYKALPEWQGW